MTLGNSIILCAFPSRGNPTSSNQLPSKVKTFTLNPDTGNLTVELFAPESAVPAPIDNTPKDAPRRRQMSGLDSLAIPAPTYNLEDVQGAD